MSKDCFKLNAMFDKGSRMAGLEHDVEEIIGICGATSVSIGVSVQEETEYTGHWGHRDLQKDLSPDASTLYCTASVSKGFLSAAVGIAVDKGLLDWKTPIRTYLPEFNPVNDPNLGIHVNLIDVLCHSTGLAQHEVLHYGPFGSSISDRESLVRIINHLPTSGRHGPRFRRTWLYNNSVATLAALAIERVTGQPYTEFLRDNIFEPLAMTRTSGSSEKILSDQNIALPYARLSDGTMHQLGWTGYVDERSPGAVSCGVWSSVKDLLIWTRAILQTKHWQRGRSEPFDRVEQASTPPNVLRELHTILTGFHPLPEPMLNFGPASYALGWMNLTLPSANLGRLSFNKETKDSSDRSSVLGVDSGPVDVIIHNGKLPGYNAFVVMIPKHDTSIVVLASGATDGDPSDWLGRILLQKLFRLRPEVDIIGAARKEAEMSRRWFTDQTRCQKIPNGVPECEKWTPEDYIGSYENDELLTTVHIIMNAPELQVYFNDRVDACYPIHYEGRDSLSFLPLTRDQWIRDCMTEYFNNEMGILRFERDKTGYCRGLYWTWHSAEEASWFSKRSPG